MGPAIGANPYIALDTYLHHGRTGKAMASKVVSKNTRISREVIWEYDETDPGTPLQRAAIAVFLHRTQIVTYSDDGRCWLDHGGWDTPTTRERIREYMPSGTTLWTERGEWFIAFGPWIEQEYLSRRRARSDSWRHDGPMEWHRTKGSLPVAIVPFDEGAKMSCVDGIWAPNGLDIPAIRDRITNDEHVPEGGNATLILGLLDKYLKRIITGHLKYDTVCPQCIAHLDGKAHIFEHLLGGEAPSEMVSAAMTEYGYPAGTNVRGASLMKHTMSNAIRRYFIHHLLED